MSFDPEIDPECSKRAKDRLELVTETSESKRIGCFYRTGDPEWCLRASITNSLIRLPSSGLRFTPRIFCRILRYPFTDHVVTNQYSGDGERPADQLYDSHVISEKYGEPQPGNG